MTKFLVHKSDDDAWKECGPAIINAETGEVLPSDAPEMIALTAIWDSLSDYEKKAYHRACCLNSRKFEDLKVLKKVTELFEAADQSKKN